MPLKIIEQPGSLIIRQKISYKWNFLLIPVAVLTLFLFLQQNKVTSYFNYYNLIPFFIVLLAVILMNFMYLLVDISNSDIKYKMFPFHLSNQTITKKDLGKVEYIMFSAIGDYGGWGIRYNFITKRIAYILKGDKGILITKLSGRQVLIGTGNLALEKIQPLLDQLNSKIKS